MYVFDPQVIEEFRANNGKVGGKFEGSPLLLLTTTGRRTGISRVSPLVYTRDGNALVVAASRGGAEVHPAWYLNVQADDRVHVEVGTEAFDARARIADREERDRLYAAHAAVMPNFARYEITTARTIPIVILERNE